MIQLTSLSKVFNEGTVNENLAIHNVNLEVEDGEFVTIIGSNGAGKTTLFNLISGNMFPSAGKVVINGRNVTKDPEYKRALYVGRIFQNPTLGTAETMTLEDNMTIAHYKGCKGLKKSLNKKLRNYFREQLSELNMGLENRLKDNVGLFSGGQRQALTLLMMVLSKPDLILLDEHTAALDPGNAQMILELTLRYINEYHLTAMMITHNMSNAIAYGSRLLMMDGGEIILDISGTEKQNTTKEVLVEKFAEIRKKNLANDELLLSP